MIKKWKLILVLALTVFLVGGFFVYKNKSEIKESAEVKTGLSDDQLKEQIGQMIMVGFRGTEAIKDSEIYKIIKDVKIGGVSLTDYDVPTKTYGRNIVDAAQTKRLISDLQSYSDTPLLVAVDAEGGNVNRLKEKYGFSSILSAAKMGKDETLVTTQVESLKIVKELKELGFNMNLAPVVDVNINSSNPVIGALGRSFSSDASQVFYNARVFIQNHLNSNIIAVAKHFPGHGSSTTDTHLGLTDITNTYQEEKEQSPYQKLNDEGLLSVVMTAHIMDRNIDSNYPATLSSIFLQGILREKIGFKGVIVTDDMQMAAISDNYGFEDSIISAINAGADIIYFFNNTSAGYDSDMAYKVKDAIFNAVKDGKIKEERITESYNRIISLKKQFNLIKKETSEIKSERFGLIGMPDVTFGEAYSYAKYVQEKTGISPAFLMGVLHEELSLVGEYGMCYLTNLKTGAGITTDGKVLARTMNPKRDIPGFLTITAKLGKDPYKTLVTCPMSFGWGGAMGPADFIPSTWLRYEKQIEGITGETADPWSIRDAFLAAGIYLSESGAVSKDSNGEWKSAMIYFSGSTTSPYTWYADGALLIADKVQKYIDQIESKK